MPFEAVNYHRFAEDKVIAVSGNSSQAFSEIHNYIETSHTVNEKEAKTKA
ncbi:hypothetical protein IGM_02146 [Bacillus cereus HuB4-4]|uniref:Uncharacterized protein n=1 Tax=Bacillus cereus HuB4-4 TaxID=1053211 RepID=A0A9W5QW70_BACCE|nr:hypothetical protein IGM_02146 [Bacillus cereus HuB4-4]